MYKYDNNILAYEECDEEVACVDSGILHDVLTKHRKVFGEPGRLPAADLLPITIDTEPGKLVAQRPYRAALAKRQLIEEELDKMLEFGIIRPSQSSWSSLVTLVPKCDSSTRFCIDYRKLNDVKIKDRYPLPLITEIYDQLEGSKLFTTLDLKSGYWQQKVHPDSIEKTAFVCHRGQFEFLRLPFGSAQNHQSSQEL